jgi:hypothetical protein
VDIGRHAPGSAPLANSRMTYCTHGFRLGLAT